MTPLARPIATAAAALSATRPIIIIAILAALALTLTLAVACSRFSAAPSECVRAAESAGLSDAVTERLRNPEGLNPVERAALQRVLDRAGIADLCANAISSDNPAAPDNASDNDGGVISDLRRAVGLGSDPDPDNNDSTPNAAGPSNQQSGSGNRPANNAGASPANPTAAPASNNNAQSNSARIPADEHRRRCRFWALNNLSPVVYGEFSNLDPDNMDDLDRILWRQILYGNNHFGYYDDDFPNQSGHDGQLLPRNPGIYCRDYWAEPLNSANANLRNQAFEAPCRFALEEGIVWQYRRLAEQINYGDDNDLVHNTPNQYARILQWLDISGDHLRASPDPPYLIIHEQSSRPYAHWYDWIPTDAELREYRAEYGARLNLEWLGIVSAAGMSENSSNLRACHSYYPQLFYGYWIPLDPDQTPDANQYEELELPRYNAATTPIYLPKSVSANQVRAGYPLGETPEGYYLCENSDHTESVGYYYVSHPAGDYCEPKP